MRNDKRQLRKQKIITHQNKKFFKNFLSVNSIIMSSQENNINLLKQLPFYGKTIKPGTEKFTNAKLLSELLFFEKPIKAKIKELSIKKLLTLL